MIVVESGDSDGEDDVSSVDAVGGGVEGRLRRRGGVKRREVGELETATAGRLNCEQRGGKTNQL